MSQHDYNLANASGPNFRADANALAAAIATLNAGPTAPTPSFANQLWYDTSVGFLKKRDNGNTTWQMWTQIDSSGNILFKPGVNARSLALLNAASITVASLLATSGGDGQIYVEDRNSVTRILLDAPTTGGQIFLDGTAKRIAPALRFGPFNLAGTTGQTVTNIPADAQEVVVAFRHVVSSTNASTLIQFGTSGGLVSSGYVSTSGATAAGTTGLVLTSTAGFSFRMGQAGVQAFGNSSIVHVGSNNWVESHAGTFGTEAVAGGGAIFLSGGALTQLRFGASSTYTNGAFTVIVRF